MRVFPKTELNTSSRGEKFIWQKFKECLPDNFVSYHVYYVGMKEADIILVCPPRGILIIEVKGYLAHNIIEVPDNSTIKKKDGIIEGSPFKQARAYKFLLQEELAKIGEESLYIVPAVSYPFISAEQFTTTGLNKITPIQWAFIEDDFADMKVFFEKVDKIFDAAYGLMHSPSLSPGGLSPQKLISFRKFIEGTDDIEDFSVPKVKIQETENDIYSRLILVKAKADYTDKYYEKLLTDIKKGIITYFFTADKVLLSEMRICIDEMVSDKKLVGYSEFSRNGKTQYNNHFYNIDFADVGFDSFVLEIDRAGDTAKKINDATPQLKELDKKTSFNLSQYLIEHFEKDNLIVSAGAGTGKTHSVVSRINYLVWLHDYKAHEFAKKIVMITFTNESADDMKRKIKEFFLHKQLLTSNPDLFDYYESIADLVVCTIHSLAKKMLKKYSMFLGLGYGFKIESGSYKKRQVVREALNSYVTENNIDVQESFDIPMYELVNRIVSFIGQLDNKNVDISSSDFDFGVPAFDPNITNDETRKAMLFDLLTAVITEYETVMETHCEENNSVMLSNLIKRLKRLIVNDEFKAEMKKTPLDYLFVDEFQDTDDTQIGIMKEFAELFKFKFFVVGDVKQCIYRFRGAEVKAFDTLDDKKEWTRLSLNKNYRSDRKLLERMNTDFANWGNRKPRLLDYSADDELVGVQDMADVTADNCLVQLEHLGDWQYPLLLTLQQLKKGGGTTAILVRYNYQKNEIVELLKQHHIPVETDIGGELFKIDPTIDFFKLVQALRFNRAPEYVFNLFTTSYTDTTVDKKAVMALGTTERINDYIAAHPPFPEWNEFVEKLRLEPILKVLRDIVNKVQPWRIAADKVGEKEMEGYYLENLDILFENLLSKANSDYFTLNNISEYLEVMILTKQEEEARVSYRQSDAGKIICTTVHKAKGFEYDTVILPFGDFDISGQRKTGITEVFCFGNRVGYRMALQEESYLGQLENDIYRDLRPMERNDQMQEETRILYVAMTRAKRRLIVFVNQTSRKLDCWQAMIRGGITR